MPVDTGSASKRRAGNGRCVADRIVYLFFHDLHVYAQMKTLRDVAHRLLRDENALLASEFDAHTQYALTRARCAHSMGYALFADTVIPLMWVAHMCASDASWTARQALAELTGDGIFHDARSPPTCNLVPAIQCASDTLKLIFRMLAVPDFMRAQQVCRTWRHVCVHPHAWPFGGVDRYAALLYSHDARARHQAVDVLQSLMSERCAMRVLSSPLGIVDRILYLLTSSDTATKLSICTWLVNFTSHDHAANAEALVSAGVLPQLRHMLHQAHMPCLTIVWTLWHLTSTNTHVCKQVVAADVLHVLRQLAVAPSSSMHTKEMCAYIFRNALLILPHVQCVDNCIDALEQMFLFDHNVDDDALDVHNYPDDDVVYPAVAMALAAAYKHAPRHISSELFARIANFMECGMYLTHVLALLQQIVLVNILDLCAIYVLSNALSRIRDLGTPENASLTCMIVSQIAMQGSASVSEMIRTRLGWRMVEDMHTASTCQHRDEATWTVCNFIRFGSAADVAFLVHQGALQHLCMGVIHEDISVVQPVLGAIAAILYTNLPGIHERESDMRLLRHALVAMPHPIFHMQVVEIQRFLTRLASQVVSASCT
jgi:hypothetical protein